MASSNNVIDEIKASGSSASNTVPLTSNEPTNGALDKEMNGTATRASTPDGEEAAECGCGDESSNAKEAPVDDDIPSAKDFAKAYSLPVLDSDGKEHTFKSLVSRAGIDKHLVIFIRHFFCSVSYFLPFFGSFVTTDICSYVKTTSSNFLRSSRPRPYPRQ